MSSDNGKPADAPVKIDAANVLLNVSIALQDIAAGINAMHEKIDAIGLKTEAFALGPLTHADGTPVEEKKQ